MNRPREIQYHKIYGVEDYGVDWKSFAIDIDKYCNEQEEKIDKLEEIINKLCLILGNESFDSCYNCPFKDTVGNITKCIKKNEYDWTCTKESWKEWALEDEKTKRS